MGEGAFARGHQLGGGNAVSCNENFFAFEHPVEEFGELGFGLVDVGAGHVIIILVRPF